MLNYSIEKGLQEIDEERIKGKGTTLKPSQFKTVSEGEGF